MPNKDSADVVHFMELFGRLKEWIDHDPVGLEKLASEDESIKKICLELNFLEFKIVEYEKSQRRMFAQPVDEEFIRAWRDYEERFAPAMGEILLADLGLDIGQLTKQTENRAEILWKEADHRAFEKSRAIITALDYAYEATAIEDEFPEGFAEKVEFALQAWNDLAEKIGFDLRSVFRRRSLVPFVLVPTKISNKYGSGEKLSLFTHLEQAHDAFVLGVPFAAIALMRSIVETVLRDHYNAMGSDLEQKIDNAKGLSKPVKTRLHTLRRLANDILHLNKEKARLPVDFEKELVSLFLVVRVLIEGA